MNCCLLENSYKFKVNLNLGDKFSGVLLVCCEYLIDYQYLEILFFLMFFDILISQVLSVL